MEVGDGSNALFWKDHLLQTNGSLRDSYSELFRFAANGDALVSDYVELVNGSLQWKPLFSREAQDWELESLDHFFNNLYAVNIFFFFEKSVLLLKPMTKEYKTKITKLGEHHTASLSKLDQSKTQTRMYKGEYSSYYKEFDVGLKQEF